MPKVFIIIINFNGWKDTQECLASLDKVNYDNFEIVLVDNASKERPQEADLKEFPNLKILYQFNKENLGFAGGNNQGIKIALSKGADYILLLNNDTVVASDFLSELVKEGEEDSKNGILGPLIYFYDRKDVIWSAGGRINKRFYRGELIGYQEEDKNQYQATEQVDYISGTCLLIKREVIEKIGLLSEDYFLYYEDTDWCQRAKLAGWRCLFVPSSKIYHKISSSTREFSYPYIYYHSRNGLIFCLKFGRKWQAFILSLWLFIKQIVKIAIGYKKQWAKPVLHGILDFWLDKKGKLESFY